LREQSEEEKRRAEVENKQRNQEMHAKLSEIKGKDVKELDVEVERKYDLSLAYHSHSRSTLTRAFAITFAHRTNFTPVIALFTLSLNLFPLC
jgi:hypothetical protein